MAQVTIDYEEFDSIKKHEKELEKRVEEEINKEREFYNKSAADYQEKEKSLRSELEKEMQGKVAIADAKAKEAEDKYLRLRNYLHPVIHRLLSVNSELEGKLFPPYKEIGALGNIIEDVKSVLKKEEVN